MFLILPNFMFLIRIHCNVLNVFETCFCGKIRSYVFVNYAKFTWVFSPHVINVKEESFSELDLFSFFFRSTSVSLYIMILGSGIKTKFSKFLFCRVRISELQIILCCSWNSSKISTAQWVVQQGSNGWNDRVLRRSLQVRIPATQLFENFSITIFRIYYFFYSNQYWYFPSETNREENMLVSSTVFLFFQNLPKSPRLRVADYSGILHIGGVIAVT